jgi:hypothetical protein
MSKILKFFGLSSPNTITSFCYWQTVTASAMEMNAVNQLEKEHLMQMEMAPHPMQNVWAKDVCYTDTRTEAWNMVQEQLRR